MFNPVAKVAHKVNKSFVFKSKKQYNRKVKRSEEHTSELQSH